MASCYGDGCCRVWDARTWKLLGRLKGAHASPCYGAAKTDGFVASWAAEGLAFWSCEDALRKADATKKATAPITDAAGNDSLQTNSWVFEVELCGNNTVDVGEVCDWLFP